MTDPCQQYRLHYRQQQELKERKIDAEVDFILFAKHPEFYTELTIAEIRERYEKVRQQLEEITAILTELEKVPNVRTMLLREQGLLTDSKTWQPVLRPFTAIEERTVMWLWHPYLPMGRLTILEGDPGQGKTWFALALATCVSLGAWLDVGGEANQSQPAGVVYLSCEDDAEDTTKKRLRLLQADQSRIYELVGKARSSDRHAVNLTLKDILVIRQAVKDAQAKLLVIDPIQGYLPQGIDMNRAEHIRPLLMTLQRIAKEEQLAVLLVRHLAKGSKERALYKGLGSIDFTAAARSVLLCAERKELEEWTSPDDGSKPVLMRRRFAVAQVKNNLAARGPAVEFELRRDSFLWVGTADVTADQLLAPVSIAADEEAAIQEAKKFLLYLLQGPGEQVGTILKEAKRAGIEQSAIIRAKLALAVEVRQGEDGWSWWLPGKYMAN